MHFTQRTSYLQRTKQPRQLKPRLAPECILKGFQIFLTVFDLPAELPQCLCQTAHGGQPFHGQHREYAKGRPPQQVSIVDSL